MITISPLSDSIRYTGRWSVNENSATSTTPGAYFEVAFKGTWCDLRFDVTGNAEAYPHLYIQLDGGAKIDARLDRCIRIEAPDDNNHVATVCFKSAVQEQQRWYEPLVAKVTFIGTETDACGTLPVDNRKIIEFLGDSITEGIWVDEYRRPCWGSTSNRENMVFQNDSTATYAYLTAKALGMRPYIMGYGSLGLAVIAAGGVPKAKEAYPFCFNDAPKKPIDAEIIVINYGVNDLFHADFCNHLREYEEFLLLVRKLNPKSKIVALSAFYGAYPEEKVASLSAFESYPKEVEKLVNRYNKEHSDDVLFIDSTGWIPQSPMHPTREGHKIVAENLVKCLKDSLGI